MELVGAFKSPGSEEVVCIAANSDSTLLASGAESSVCLWDVRARELSLKANCAFQEEDVTSMCFSKREPHLLWTSAGKTLSLIDIRSFEKAVAHVTVNSDEINQIAMNETSSYLAAADDNGDIRIIDTSKQKLFKTLRKQHENICSCVQFSCRPKRTEDLFSGSLDNSIARWNFTTARCLQRVDTKVDAESQGINPPMVHSLSMASDGMLAAGLGDCSILVLTEKPNGRLEAQRITDAHSYSVSQVHFPVFDPLRVLVSGGNDRRVCVFRRTDPAPLPQLAHTLLHGQKVNWMTSLRDDIVVVADCSENISLYKVLP